MKKIHMAFVVVAAMFLSGCSHSQWASIELATQGASWLNPVATAIHFTASAGRAMTDPQDELQEKRRHCEEEREKDQPPDESPPEPSLIETE